MSNTNTTQATTEADATRPDWSAIRVSAGYKKTVLARHLGVSSETIRRFEAGSRLMGETTRARLALAYRKLAAEVAAVPALPEVSK